MAMDSSLGEIATDLAARKRIVDDVLASARLALDTSGPSSQPALPMLAERVDARALLEESAAKFRTAHPARPLEPALGDALPAVNADPVLIRRVFDNLLDSACKYTKHVVAAILVETRLVGDDLLVEIVDPGVGVSREDLGRLFEPFFRAHRSRNRATCGLGLGRHDGPRSPPADEGHRHLSADDQGFAKRRERTLQQLARGAGSSTTRISTNVEHPDPVAYAGQSLGAATCGRRSLRRAASFSKS